MNIDKDIEKLEKAIKVLTGNDTGIKLDFEGTAQAIENVLSTLKRERAKIKVLSKINKEIFDEKETYKKIAEKLAHYIWKYDSCEYEIGKNGKCEGYYIDKDCTEKCIIDWARKEVEKDGN